MLYQIFTPNITLWVTIITCFVGICGLLAIEILLISEFNDGYTNKIVKIITSLLSLGLIIALTLVICMCADVLQNQSTFLL